MNIIQKYDITGIFAQKLNLLRGFKMICICDDSTSMREILNKGQTKWDELKQSIEIVLDIGSAYNVDCDVLFLNRPGFRSVKHISQLSQQFSRPPEGRTPLTKCFQLALEINRQVLKERKLLVLIFTDGCPTCDYGNPIKEFKEALECRNPMNRIFVTIVACTEDVNALRYLNKWDKTIPNFDVVDDYESEKKEIYNARKFIGAFTYGDYIAKILLGSFVIQIDELDEADPEDQEEFDDLPDLNCFDIPFVVLFIIFIVFIISKLPNPQ
jgi:thiol-disulfide isomerase/thioredoxin